jgi:hypothetical protein
MATTNLRSVEKDRIPEAAGYGESMIEAERDADELLATAWRKKGPSGLLLPVDPFRIATDLGIRVLTGGDFPREISGVSRKAPGYRDSEILISPHDSLNRQRFTCAHELGHYTDRIKSGSDGHWDHVDGRELLLGGDENPEEAYANRFAAELLMPRDLILGRIERTNVAALAIDFGVAADAMRFRLDTLEQG